MEPEPGLLSSLLRALPSPEEPDTGREKRELPVLESSMGLDKRDAPEEGREKREEVGFGAWPEGVPPPANRLLLLPDERRGGGLDVLGGPASISNASPPLDGMLSLTRPHSNGFFV